MLGAGKTGCVPTETLVPAGKMWQLELSQALFLPIQAMQGLAITGFMGVVKPLQASGPASTGFTMVKYKCIYIYIYIKMYICVCTTFFDVVIVK